MSRTHWLLATIAVLSVSIPADAGGLFSRKGKSDLRVRQLVETLRSDPDGSRRRSAVVELKEADPRTQLEVIPALVTALQRDSSAEVRASAAEVIGRFKQVYPVAGLALETAAESDVSPLVRDAALQALWEYHLNGYRSARGADGIAGQTMEPPLARPAVRPAGAQVVVPVHPVPRPRPVAIAVPPRPVGLPAVTLSPPATVVSLRPPMDPPQVSTGPRVILTAAPPLQLNVTEEPPLAKVPGLTRSLPTEVRDDEPGRSETSGNPFNPVPVSIPSPLLPALSPQRTPVGLPSLALPRSN